MAIKFLNSIDITGQASVSNIPNDDNAYTGILVWDGTILKYRTKAEILSDIGAGTGGGSVTNVSLGTLNGLSGSVSNSTSTPSITLTNTDKGSDQDIFKTIAVSGQTSVTANSNSTTLTMVAAGGMTITTDNTAKSITLNSANDNDNDYVDGVSWDSSTGVITLTRTGSLADLTVDIDGRYIEGATSGTLNYIPKYTSTSAIGNSIMFNGTSGIGINNTSPSEALDVTGAIELSGGLKMSTGQSIIWQAGNAKIQEGGYALKFETWTGSALTEKFIILGDGKVGVGTSTPAELFEVSGGHAKITNAGNANLYINANNSGSDATVFFEELDSVKAKIQHDASANALLLTDGDYVDTMWVKNTGVGIGVNPGQQNKVSIKTTPTTNDDANRYGINVDFDLTGSNAISTDRTYIGCNIDLDSDSTSGDTTDEVRLYGIKSESWDTGHADVNVGVYGKAKNYRSTNTNVTHIKGGEFFAIGGNTAGTTSSAKGISVSASVQGAGGTVGALYGIQSTVSADSSSDKVVPVAIGGFFKNDIGSTTSGMFTTAEGIRAEVENDNSGTMATAIAGKLMLDNKAGTITNAYQLRLQTSNTATITNSWGIYQTGNTTNYLSGKQRFASYGSGTYTGTAVKNLQVDTNGNVIESTVTDGTVTSITFATATGAGAGASISATANPIVTSGTVTIGVDILNQAALGATAASTDRLLIYDVSAMTNKYCTVAELGAGSGTVTSVGLTETGSALTITGSPITGSGTINIAGAGSSSQVILGNLSLGNYTQGTVTSVSAGKGITIESGSSLLNPTLGIKYCGDDNAILVSDSDEISKEDVIWFSDSSDDDLCINHDTVANLVALAPQGTITAVIAGMALTGGGSTGSVTLNVGIGHGLTGNASNVAVNYTNAATNVISSATDGTSKTLADGDLFIWEDKSDGAVYQGSMEQVCKYIKNCLKGGTIPDIEIEALTSNTIDLSGSTNYIALGDSAKTYWGTSKDAHMSYDGTNNKLFLELETTATNFEITSNGSNKFTFARSTGNFTARGNVTGFSDERLKTNIETLDGSKVLEMRGVSFTKDGAESSGVIAQELEKVAPELVHTADDEMGTKSVAYGNMVGYLIEAVKDQQKQIDELKAKLESYGSSN